MGNQSISVDTLPNNISNSPPSLASAMPLSPSYRQQPQQQHQQQKQQQASLNSSNAQLINSPPLQSSSPQEQQSGSPPNRFESTTLNQQLSIDVFILLILSPILFSKLLKTYMSLLLMLSFTPKFKKLCHFTNISSFLTIFAGLVLNQYTTNCARE